MDACPLPSKGEEAPIDCRDDQGNPVRRNEFVNIHRPTMDQLIGICRDRLPGKSFGFLSGPLSDQRVIDGAHLMQSNLREEFADLFREAGGDFYFDEDHGFVIDPEEHLKLARGLRETGRAIRAVFHNHRYQDSIPTLVDTKIFNPEIGLWNLILSFVKDGRIDLSNPNHTAYWVVEGEGKKRYYDPIRLQITD